MNTRQAEVESAMRFLRTAFETGPRKLAEVEHEARIYEIPDWALREAIERIGAEGWIVNEQLVWEPEVMSWWKP